MPKTELTAVFLDLADDGYFKNPAVKDGASHLEVTYNQGQVEKAWNREPRLEQLVDLLKRHGSPSTKPPEEAHPTGILHGPLWEKPSAVIGGRRQTQSKPDSSCG